MARRFAKTIVCLVVVLWASPALAAQVLLEDGKEYELPASHQYRSTLHFPSAVIGLANGNEEQWTVVILGSDVHVQPVMGAKATNINLTLVSGDRVVVNLIRDEEKPVKQLIFLESKLDRPQCKKEEAGEEITITHMRSRWDFRPPKGSQVRVGEHELSARLAHQLLEGPAMRYRVRLRHHEGGPYPFKALEVLVDPRASKPVEALIVWDSENGRIPTELSAERDLYATVIIKDATAIGDRMALRLVPAQHNLFPATFEFEDERPNVGRVTIRAQAIGGLLQIEDGLGLEREDITVEVGAGARIAYSVSQHVAVEGDVAVLRSGAAQFDDVVWDGVAGDMERESTTYRMLAGAVLRKGEIYVPFIRGALGPRLASHRRALTSGLKEDSSYDFGFSISFEIGIDAWLGNSLTAGIAGSYVGDLAGETSMRAFEGRLHLGYAWKP